RAAPRCSAWPPISMVAICRAQYELTVFASVGQTRLSARFHFDSVLSISRARFTICRSVFVIGGLTLESSGFDCGLFPWVLAYSGERRIAPKRQPPKYVVNFFHISQSSEFWDANNG